MSHLSLDQQLRRYGDDLQHQQECDRFNAAPTQTRTTSSRLVFLAIVTLFVVVIGAGLLLVRRGPSAQQADGPAVLDQESIAGYIAESSEMLNGMRVGDPCPVEWPSTAGPLPLEPVSIHPDRPGCTILAWIPGSVTGLPSDAHYQQDGTLIEDAGSATTVLGG
jgi:hypothetical protein